MQIAEERFRKLLTDERVSSEIRFMLKLLAELTFCLQELTGYNCGVEKATAEL